MIPMDSGFAIRECIRVVLVTDDLGRSAHDLAALVAEAVAGGVTCVQLRERSADARAALKMLRLLHPVCAAAGVPLLINGSMIQRLGGPLRNTEGAHLQAAGFPPEGPPFPERLRFWFPRGPLIGYSAHSLAEAAAAFAAAAHFVTLSPVFDTPSKRDILAPCGPDIFGETRRTLGGRPVVALGGIDLQNAPAVIEAGADGVAVMRAVMEASDPRRAASELRQCVENSLRARNPAS
jgi:thiamine-phosphate pyrophosphorylase